MMRFSSAQAVVAGVLLLCIGCDDPKTADPILNAFSSACPSQREWTQAAIAQSMALSQAFEDIRKRDFCQAVVDSSIQASRNLEASLMSLNQAEADAKYFSQTSHQLLMEIQNTTDPAIQSLLATQYSVERFNYLSSLEKSRLLEDPSGTQRASTTLREINSQVLYLMSQGNVLASCLADNGSVALQLGANLLSLSANLAPALVGVGIVAAKDLLVWGVDLLRSMPDVEAIQDLRRSRLKEALACGIEALTTQYCKAEDAKQLIAIRADQLGKAWKPERFFWGMDLLDRHIGVFYKWLSRFEIGPDPEDLDAGYRVVMRKSNMNRLENMQIILKSIISEANRDLKRGVKDENTLAKDAIKKILSVFIATTGGEVIDTGIFKGESYVTLTPLFAGLTKPAASPFDIDAYLQGETIKDGLEGVNKRASVRLENELKIAKRRYADIIIASGDALLQSARDVTLNSLSAVEVLGYVLEFLSTARVTGSTMRTEPDPICTRDSYQYEMKPSGDFEQDHLHEICRLFARAISLIEKRKDPASDTPDLVLKSGEAVLKINEIFQLSGGMGLVPTVLNRFILNDLTLRIIAALEKKESDPPEEVARKINDILYLGNLDLNRALSDNGQNDPDGGVSDINRAQSLTKATLAVLRQRFQDALEETLAEEKKLAEEEGEGGPDHYAFNQLCVLTYISGGEWPSSLQKLCQGAQVQSVYKSSGLHLSVDELREQEARLGRKRRFEDFACRYYEFSRQSRIYGLRKNSRFDGSAASDDVPKADEHEELWETFYRINSGR